MTISSDQVLRKMGELVEKARQAPTEEKKQGYILAIQSLCEVLVEDRKECQPVKAVASTNELSISKPIEIPEANGSSLFDF